MTPTQIQKIEQAIREVPLETIRKARKARKKVKLHDLVFYRPEMKRKIVESLVGDKSELAPERMLIEWYIMRRKELATGYHGCVTLSGRNKSVYISFQDAFTNFQEVAEVEFADIAKDIGENASQDED